MTYKCKKGKAICSSFCNKYKAMWAIARRCQSSAEPQFGTYLGVASARPELGFGTTFFPTFAVREEH